MDTPHAVEAGRFSAIAFDNGLVYKSTLAGYSADDACAFAENLAVYDAQLASEPIQFARLRSVEVVPGADQHFNVSHTVEHIDGPSVAQLTGTDCCVAVTHILSGIAAMSTINSPNQLRVPLDAKVENYHVGPDGPVLIDIFPPLNRGPNGALPALGVSPGLVGRRFQEWTMGTKSGVMTKVLSSAIGRGDSLNAQLRHIATAADDWCYDLLPSQLDPQIAARVRRQIATRFVPYLTVARAHMIME